MFIGHFALAFGAKKYAPRVSLGILFFACQLADLIWPNLVLLGIERVEIEPGITAITPLNFLHYPYSHSFVALALWGVLFSALLLLLRRIGIRVAMIISALVFSHWVLDFVSHRPDMPLTLAGPTRLGLGLWNFPLLAVTVELLLFAFGVWLYSRYTNARNLKGSIGFLVLVALLLFIYVANLFAPPPPSSNAVAWSVQAMWLIVAMGFWVDHYRVKTIPV